MANINSITPILKERYRGRIVDQLQNEIVALRRVERSRDGVTSEIGGKYVTFPIHTRRNSGIGSRLEGEALPSAGQQGYAAARVGLKYAYGTIEVTGQAVALSETDPQAFAKVITEETEGLKNDLRKDMNRQVYGTGNGALGVVGTAGTTVNTVTVVDARSFNLGDVVDIITLPSTVAVSARTVTAINLSTGVVTLSGAAFSSTVGQIVVRTGSGPSASGNRELTGLGAIVSDSGTIYNIDPSVEPTWKASVFANGGTARAISEGLMTQMVDTIRTQGGKTTLILTSLGVRRSYANLLMQLRNVVNTQEFTGGFKGLAFATDGVEGELPVISDVDAPLGTMHFINEDALTLYRDQDWNWVDRDGSMWKQKVDSSGRYDAYVAHMAEYHELGTNRRNTHGKITDITEE